MIQALSWVKIAQWQLLAKGTTLKAERLYQRKPKTSNEGTSLVVNRWKGPHSQPPFGFL